MVQIPIIVKLHEDSEEQILFAAQCAAAGHIVVVSAQARTVTSLLQAAGSKNQKTNKSEDLTNNLKNERSFDRLSDIFDLKSLTTENRTIVYQFLTNAYSQVGSNK